MVMNGQNPSGAYVLTDFTIPDTVCTGQPVTINNTSGNASSWYWSFCSGNAASTPLGQVISSTFSAYSQPSCMAIVRDAGGIFSFITNSGSGNLIRNNHGNSLLGPVVNTTDMGSLGGLTTDERGIQILNEDGHWYGFVANESFIMRLDFGGSLQNTPMMTAFSGVTDTVALFNGLTITREGTDWIGFVTNLAGSSLHRITWGNTLANPPFVTGIGSIGGMSDPYQCVVLKQNMEWYMLVCNAGNNSLTRLRFGNSLLNTPVAENLGNLGLLKEPRGIVMVDDCQSLNGLVSNNRAGSNPLVRLNLSGGIGGTITAQPLGNIGNLNRPAGFSDLLRIGDTIYTGLTNSASTSPSLLYFPSCTSASLTSSTLRDPPSITYDTPGTYNIRLITNEGMPDQESICKPIHVIPALNMELGNDTTVCAGKMMTLGLKTVPSHDQFTFLWSTGDTTSFITTDQPGSYWVKTTNQLDCETIDTIVITQMPPVTGTTDTLLCFGERYFAGGEWQTRAGTYRDTVQTILGCDSVHITNLSFKPEIVVSIGRDTVLCPGESLTMVAMVSNATFQWQDGSTDSVFTATESGEYWVHVFKNGCMDGDTLLIRECPSRIWLPTAFTPNGDGLNDLLRAKGISILNFRMEVYDRSGMRLFSSNEMENGWDGRYNGKECPAGVYTCIITFEAADTGESRKFSGSFTLIR